MRQLFFKTWIIFLVITYAHGQNRGLDKGKITSKNYYSEISYQNINGKLIIPVNINGKTYRFLFDTGAPNLISSELKKKLEFDSERSIAVSDANNANQQMEIITIPLLTIGTISFQNTASLVFNGENNLIFDCLKIDGIIGSNILKKSIVQILSKEKLIIITNKTKNLNLNGQKGSKLSLVGSQGSPYITIALIGDKKGSEKVLFDSGSNAFYDLCLAHYNTFKSHNIMEILNEGQGANSIGLFGIGQEQKQYRIKIPQLSINGTTFTNVTTITKNDNNSRVGSQLLDYGNVTIDFKNKKFYFDPFTSPINLDEKQFGFSPTIVNNKLVVGIVWDDSLNEKIQFGDEILEINGLIFENYDFCNFITQKSLFAESEVLNIVFKNNEGETYKALFKRR